MKSVEGEEGYVVLAFDDARYLDLAANLALSIKRHDYRPVSVLINPAIPFNPAYESLFDHIVRVPNDPAIRGAMNKARLFDYTPFDRTLYVDADCLLFSPRIEFFWRKYRGHAFAVEGRKQVAGPAFACSLGEKDAAALCQLLGVPYLSVFNAGVMYFEQSQAAKAVFERVLALYHGPHRDAISYRYKHAGEYADEPFFGAALGALDIAPFEPPPTQRLQVTTPDLIGGTMDIDLGHLEVIKQAPGGKRRVWAGVLCHFCGLAPMDTYFDLADKLRRGARLPAMNRQQFNPVVLTANHREWDETP